jgi:hypothetical protein
LERVVCIGSGQTCRFAETAEECAELSLTHRFITVPNTVRLDKEIQGALPESVDLINEFAI